ncbi:MAG: DUF1552 domain-containing protein [Deltaproteobacteria bacterium]|nr:DUF1552 domain-containing protein [Deltaproteobacteria bacterium]
MPRPSRTFTRRMLLRGTGSIAIGLPLLPEFMPRASAAQDDDIPCRLFTMSFGLGIDEMLQMEQFSGPLQPFAPFENKTAFFTNVDGGPLLGSGTPHFRSAAATFTGVPQQSDPEYHAGGPSMEQVMKRALHPNGVPNVTQPELSAGIWSRTGAVSQFTRHWNTDGSPGQRPERRPSRVFELLFGTYEPSPPTGTDPDPAAIARNHVHRSVLDSVMDQYSHLTSDASPLGAASKARIDNHLAAIRDVEQQLAPMDGKLPPPLPACEPPSGDDYLDPGGYSFYDNENGPAGPGAPAIDWEVANEAMRLIGELMALGVSCDAIRFGSLLCVGGGGHIRFQGQYSALGDSLDFSAMFDNGTPHDVIFHNYNRDAIRLYQHFSISQLMHMLTAMDSMTEPNGRTVLDNSLVLVGTEYGENHDASHTFHAVVGGGDRFNPGWYSQALLPSHVYHEALAAYGVDSGIGELWGDFDPTEISGFRNV